MLTEVRALHPIAPEEHHGEVWKARTEDGRVGDAAAQARFAEERSLGTHGQEPEAGDRDRLERSPKERREGAAAQAVTLAVDEDVTVAVP